MIKPKIKLRHHIVSILSFYIHQNITVKRGAYLSKNKIRMKCQFPELTVRGDNVRLASVVRTLPSWNNS
jgi:hypothetical protein